MRRVHNTTIFDMTEMPNKTMTQLRMYCNGTPVVLNINNSFSIFEEILTCFNQTLNYIYILHLYYYYYYIIFITYFYYRK
jgi:hypothetical protein